MAVIEVALGSVALLLIFFFYPLNFLTRRLANNGSESLQCVQQNQKRTQRSPDNSPNILLTNGRFPVSLDLARQLTLSGCRVYCVDPMKFHICRFSRMVVASKLVAAPRKDPHGYVEGVKEAIKQWKIGCIVPIHEEGFCLAESKDPEILHRLYAPPWEVLIRLHSKIEYAKMARRIGLGVPEFQLCRSMDDVRRLDPLKEWAVKPVFGRANTDVHHLIPGNGVPTISINEDRQYIAQEWISGNRYCSYSIFDRGVLKVHGAYPVLETIDGSSCVYFESCHHAKIREYVELLAEYLYPLHGQVGLDFVETANSLVTIDCNPRATSGVHLWSGTPYLAGVFTGRIRGDVVRPPRTSQHDGVRREVIPGMLMWEHKHVTLERYLKHVWRLVSARDIIWNWSDFMPSISSPFLLTYYYTLRRWNKLTLPDLFQWDLIWEPQKESLEKLKMLEKTMD